VQDFGDQRQGKTRTPNWARSPVFYTFVSLSVLGRQSPTFPKAAAPERASKSLLKEAYYVHVWDIYRALEDAHFKAHILKLTALPELPIEDIEKEDETLTRKA
jgi:hypothetical protein